MSGCKTTFTKAVRPEPLFKENFLNYKDREVSQGIDFSSESKLFEQELDKATKENDIQSYIKKDKKWFIPYSLLQGYNFYNHGGAYLFVEQKLGAEYQVDYCLLGHNSDGWHLLLIEFENPNTEYLLSSSASETECVRKGLTQIRDWKRWLDDNRNYFMKSIGLADKGIDIPTSRIHYLLVVSRRKFFNKQANDVRSQTMYENNNLNIISYDRIVDNIALITG